MPARVHCVRLEVGAFFCMVLAAAPAGAVDSPTDADHALACRPTIACTADIAAPGTLELEAGVSVASASGGGRGWTYPFLLKQTVTKVLQLQLGSNGYSVVHGSGAPARYLDNLAVGPKLHLLDQGKVAPALGISAAMSVPTFEAAGYARHVDASAVAYVTKDIGPVHADLNLGANVWGLDDDAALQPFGALALSASLYGPIGALLEGYAFSAAAPLAPRDGGVRAGFTLVPRPWWVFDFGGDVGWFPTTRSSTAFVGMTIVPVLFRRTNEDVHER